jgi:uncharacterized protein
MASGDRRGQPSAIEMREAHFPGRAPIEAYGNGGFRFAGMSHRGSILCLPDGIHAWNVESAAGITLASFAPVLAQAGQIEILLCGMGPEIVPIRPEWRQALRDHAIQADAMTTGAAVRTFNVLLSEGRAVAAALIAVP